MNALQSIISPSPSAARLPSDQTASDAHPPPIAHGTPSLDAEVVEDRLAKLFRLSTRRGLIHPLHHVMLRFRKEGATAHGPRGGQP